MKFDILNRFSGEVQVTAEIDCDASTIPSVKLGLAVKWAIKEKANLVRANLYGANLDGANLDGANLDGANLDGANLDGANLYGANLYGANLVRANLVRANLDGANLVRANLYGANLDGANLDGANLYGANLDGANLYGANLYGANLVRANLVRANLDGANLVRANLDGANLYGANLVRANLWVSAGNDRHIRTLQTGVYRVSYTDTMMQIGCQRHPIEEWWTFDDRKILQMDGKGALEFWKTWKPILQRIIAAAPAAATGYVEKRDQVAA
ncbi:pentapeptide repeat-containing protein [Rhizobium phaseoli]|uniref:pentapeptide repeat-containing protein n=1 Tax=Rhizobium phaseoli TaxID=396 RepID=UPI002552417C|nr:pentapeptide repeat-containing protein [Rhizobium phaseoli]MDK4727418.1 pentapeptide repeat-containing protein [Rhizobium phaseoli]